MKHFLIFAIQSVCYGSYAYFADALGNALTDAGHTVETFAYATEAPESLECLFNRTFDAIFDFNSGLPRLTMEDGSFFLDHIRAPFYNILLDHPLYHHNSLKQPLADFHALCMDENHRDYILACYPHIASAAVFPMTGEDIAPMDVSYPSKKIDVLFSGTYTNYREVENAIHTTPPFLENLTKQLIEHIQANPALTQEAAFQLLLPSLEASEIITETFPLHMQACFLCDAYLRAYNRERLLLQIAKAGLPLTLCGNGWRKSPFAAFPQVQIIDDIAFQDTFSLFRLSKITVNLLPEFKNGSHDRIYSAILNHSLCMTDATPYLTRRFADGEGVCYYDIQDLDALTHRIADLLASPAQLSQIAQSGYSLAKKMHSWQARAAYLLECI